MLNCLALIFLLDVSYNCVLNKRIGINAVTVFSCGKLIQVLQQFLALALKCLINYHKSSSFLPPRAVFTLLVAKITPRFAFWK